ncbi:MAG: sigma-70 family RNA polymerase sigma factor, partial [Clostridia bacterium]|nr:sigma-70 family RNA polymerase sigma factor [Clostridia bacterium]
MYRVQCEKVVNFSVFASVLPKNGNSSNDLDRVYISGKGQFGLQFGKVEICGINTAAIKVLSEEEKRRLLERARSGDKTARDQLIEGNLRLVLSAIQRFSNRGENPDDLFQVGCIGLIKAIENFDLSLDVKFSTYVYPMIIGEVRRYLRDNNAIRISRSMRDLAYRALQARELLARRTMRDPTVEEI